MRLVHIATINNSMVRVLAQQRVNCNQSLIDTRHDTHACMHQVTASQFCTNAAAFKATCEPSSDVHDAYLHIVNLHSRHPANKRPVTTGSCRAYASEFITHARKLATHAHILQPPCARHQTLRAQSRSGTIARSMFGCCTISCLPRTDEAHQLCTQPTAAPAHSRPAQPCLKRSRLRLNWPGDTACRRLAVLAPTHFSLAGNEKLA
jgi:hypothetical protein